MSDIYLPLKWACSLHHEEPELRLFGFDGDGFIYVLGACPYGHDVQVTINNRELKRLQQEAIRLISAHRPINEDDVRKFSQDLDQAGIWDELGDTDG